MYRTQTTINKVKKKKKKGCHYILILLYKNKTNMCAYLRYVFTIITWEFENGQVWYSNGKIASDPQIVQVKQFF